MLGKQDSHAVQWDVMESIAWPVLKDEAPLFIAFTWDRGSAHSPALQSML
jgi:hypothetical protein